MDSGDVLKHKRDVFRLFQIADPEFTIQIPEMIEQDISRFLSSVQAEGVDLKSLGISGMGQDTAIDSIRALFSRQ